MNIVEFSKILSHLLPYQIGSLSAPFVPFQKFRNALKIKRKLPEAVWIEPDARSNSLTREKYR